MAKKISEAELDKYRKLCESVPNDFGDIDESEMYRLNSEARADFANGKIRKRSDFKSNGEYNFYVNGLFESACMAFYGG